MSDPILMYPILPQGSYYYYYLLFVIYYLLLLGPSFTVTRNAKIKIFEKRGNGRKTVKK
jgi:hypothetical protein